MVRSNTRSDINRPHSHSSLCGSLLEIGWYVVHGMLSNSERSLISTNRHDLERIDLRFSSAAQATAIGIDRPERLSKFVCYAAFICHST
jgi:hypothetical protein